MLANYTLPTSKDSRSAYEYFDQVLFVELNRAESQRFLDEMKRDTSMKPCMSSKLDKTSQMSYCRTFMPHCPETPVQSVTGLSFRKQDAGDPGKAHTSIRINRNPLLESITIQDVILTESEAAAGMISPRLTIIKVEVPHMFLFDRVFQRS